MHSLTYSLRKFAYEHDEIPAFHAAYLVLTFLIAALFTMGAFGLLILAHAALDTIKYREVHGYKWGKVLEGVFRESLVDITLFSVGITFAVYLHHSVVGMASLSGLFRAEVTLIEFLGTTIPKMEIFQRFLKIMAHVQHYLDHVDVHFQRCVSFTEKIYLTALFSTCVLLLLAPSILHIDALTFQSILLDEVLPSLR